MAKRFIDTDLFRKPFMRSLEAPYKALWIYLLCECDHAGIWSVELDVAQLRMGMKLDPEKAVEKMAGAVVVIDGGAKWFLPDFVAFQYGTLNPANRVHESVLALLSKYGVDPNSLSQNKGLGSPLQGAKDKDKDNSKGKERATPAPVDLEWPPWAGPNTQAKWEDFKAHKLAQHKFRYRSAKSEQAAINLLAKYFTNGKDCCAALEEAMAKGWQFPVDPAGRVSNNGNGFGGHKPSGMSRDAAEAEMRAIRIANGRDPDSGAVMDDECSRDLLIYRGIIKPDAR